MRQKLLTIPRNGSLVLLAYMPFHVFLVQSLSLLTGGLSVWKAAKDVATMLLVMLTVLVVWWQQKQSRQFNWLVGLTLGYGLIFGVVWLLNPHIHTSTALLGTVYDNRLLWFLVIGMGTALLWPKLDERRIIKFVLAVSTVVCLLGVLQYFLPKDILTHLGYSITRGVKPAFFIDDKPDLPRIMSTLRDPNSLGAYLMLPITLIVYKLFAASRQRRMLLLGLLGLHGLALLLTFSRSAWLGTAASLAILMLYQFRKTMWPWFVKYWPLLIGSVLLIGSLTLLAKDQYAVQNILVHSDENTVLQDSNSLHITQVKKGLNGIVHKPLGHGPGTAGLVSIQNPDGGLLTENYYVQIGYEVGIIGLAVFVAANIYAYMLLQKKRSVLAIALLASFWGYVLCNMLLHTWSNEAVALQWWLLTGLALALSRRRPVKQV